MNLYDKEQIKCSRCGKCIGEIFNDSSIVYPLCKTCNKIEKKTVRKGIDSILVPIDDAKKSKQALDAAIYLAKYLGASIMLFKVISNMEIGEFSFIREAMKESRKNAEKSIRIAKEYCESKNIVAKHLLAIGEEADQIIKTAIKHRVDLILMESSGKNALKELIFGSISNYVMHNSDIPVMIVKKKSPKLDTKKSKPKTQKLRRQGGGIHFSKMKQNAGLK